MTLARGLALTYRLRAAGVTQPLLLMGYVNPILAYGVARYVADAAAAGAAGFIVPDLPPEEAGDSKPRAGRTAWRWSFCWRRPPPRNASLRWSATRRASSTWCRWRASPARGTNCRPTWPRSSTACTTRLACRWRSDSASPPRTRGRRRRVCRRRDRRLGADQGGGRGRRSRCGRGSLRACVERRNKYVGTAVSHRGHRDHRGLTRSESGPPSPFISARSVFSVARFGAS